MTIGKHYIAEALEKHARKLRVKHIDIADDITPALLQQLKGVAHIFCVSDENTETACGAALKEILATHHQLSSLVMPAGTKAYIQHAKELAAQAKATPATLLLAIGSGSVNDITKLAAYQLDLPYIIVGTAASMNGYVAANASIIHENNHKQSVTAQPPIAAFFPLEVLQQAPIRLALAGLADSMCYASCMLDAALSHRLLGTAFHHDYFTISHQYGKYFLQNGEKLLHGEKETVIELIEWLISAGVAMTLAGSSAPASQGEHLLAHLLESAQDERCGGDGSAQSGAEVTNGGAVRDDPASCKDILHGEMIAPCTLWMLRHQAAFLAGNAAYDEVRWPAYDEAALRENYGKALHRDRLSDAEASQAMQHALQGMRAACEVAGDNAVRLDSSNTKAIGIGIKNEGVSNNIDTEMPALCNPKTMHAALTALYTTLGIYTALSALGFDEQELQRAIDSAPSSRDRLTFLDLESAD